MPNSPPNPDPITTTRCRCPLGGGGRGCHAGLPGGPGRGVWDGRTLWWENARGGLHLPASGRRRHIVVRAWAVASPGSRDSAKILLDRWFERGPDRGRSGKTGLPTTDFAGTTCLSTSLHWHSTPTRAPCRRHVAGSHRPAVVSDATIWWSARELGISELVTNALLHAEAPISVRLRGTSEHPRVEVSDGSDALPMLTPRRPDGDDLDQLMATVGRGLDIVAMCAVAWGATIEQDGKCIWFEPATAPHQDVGPEAALLLVGRGRLPGRRGERRPGRPRPIVMRDLPVAQLTEFRGHYQELRRELRLLSLAHQDDYPLAQDLTQVFHRFERSFPALVAHAVPRRRRARRRHLRPAHRAQPVGRHGDRADAGAPRPRRRVLPGAAPPRPGPDAAASASSSSGTSASSSARPAARRPRSGHPSHPGAQHVS